MTSKTIVKIGPEDHGRLMSLADFEHAEVQEGFNYELSRGVITVTDVPGRRHLALMTAIRDELIVFKRADPGKIHTVAGGSDCKLLLPSFQSERHPDIAVYKTAPPEDENDWINWVPEIVVEVISPGSEQRAPTRKKGAYAAAVN